MSSKRVDIERNRALLQEMRNMQRNTRIPEDQFDLAQLAILNVIEAFKGQVSEEKILEAIGNSEDPNAVSRGLRSRLSPRWFQ